MIRVVVLSFPKCLDVNLSLWQVLVDGTQAFPSRPGAAWCPAAKQAHGFLPQSLHWQRTFIILCSFNDSDTLSRFVNLYGFPVGTMVPAKRGST